MGLEEYYCVCLEEPKVRDRGGSGRTARAADDSSTYRLQHALRRLYAEPYTARPHVLNDVERPLTDDLHEGSGDEREGGCSGRVLGVRPEDVGRMPRRTVWAVRREEKSVGQGQSTRRVGGSDV